MTTKTKPKKSKETRTRYHTPRPPTKKRIASKVNLRWSEIENAQQPLVLERNGEPFAVVLRYTDYQQLREATKQEGHETTLERLAKNPLFSLPPDGFKPFKKIEPIQGEGIPASQLLIEDRR